MGQGSEPKGWMTTATLLALLAGAGYVAFDRPLEPRRPHRAVEPELHRGDEGRVDARLWQDPFEAADDVANELIEACEKQTDDRDDVAGAPMAGGCQKQIDLLLRDFRRNIFSGRQLRQMALMASPNPGPDAGMPIKLDERILLLGVTLPADPFSEAYETRMRERFAVSTALIRMGYRPRDSLSLRYVITPPAETAPSYRPLVIPYEVFSAVEPSSAQPHRVIVLWLRTTRQGMSRPPRKAKLVYVSLPSPHNVLDGYRQPRFKGRVGSIVDGHFARLIGARAPFCEWGTPGSSCIGIGLVGPPSSGELESWAEDRAFRRLAMGMPTISIETARRALASCLLSERLSKAPVEDLTLWGQSIEYCLTIEPFNARMHKGPSWPAGVASYLTQDPKDRTVDLSAEISGYLDSRPSEPQIRRMLIGCGKEMRAAATTATSPWTGTQVQKELADCLRRELPDVSDDDEQWPRWVSMHLLNLAASLEGPDPRSVLIAAKADDANGIADLILKTADRQLSAGLLGTLNGEGMGPATAATRVFVNRATARAEPDKPRRSPGGVVDRSGAGVRFVIPADHRVVAELTREMRRRLATQPCSPLSRGGPWRWGAEPETRRVLILTEGDTGYAGNLVRLLKERVHAEFAGLEGCVRLKWSVSDYLQGLDGEVGKPAPAKSDRSATPLTLGSSRPGGTSDGQRSLEYPAGRAQLDRVRDLIRQQERYGIADEAEGFDAIVIFGSDVYDKLLLVQAARQAAPRALVFTTDLDSRYLDPSEIPATQNLVVASAFGLTAKSQNREIADVTFRDSYQTSTYYAVRQAICETTRKDCSGGTEAPTVFEMGRTHAVNLNPEWLRSSGQDQVRETNRLALLVLIGGFVLFSAFIGARFVFWLSDQQKLSWRLRIMAGSLAVYVALYWFWFWPRAALPGAEPYFLLEGVSIWPTQMIRQLATMLAVVLVATMAFDLSRSNSRIQSRFDFLRAQKPLRTARPRGANWRIRLKHRWRLVSVSGWAHHLFTATMDGTRPLIRSREEVWRKYRELGSSDARVIRVSVTFAVSVVMFLLIWWAASDDINSVPARGEISEDDLLANLRNAFLANGIAISVCVLASLLCISFVIDSTRLSTTFVRWWCVCCTHGPEHLSAAQLVKSVQLVGERSAVVGKFVLYPFVIMAMLMVSRSSYFDNWGWPTSFVLVMAGVGIYAIASAWSLRNTSEKMRRSVLQELNHRLIDRSDSLSESDLASTRSAIEFISDYRVGAFSEWFRNPLLRALLLPAGGAGIATAVLDAVAGM